LNKLVILILLAIVFPLLSTQSLAYAEIKITPPMNWQADSDNNPDSMRWHRNSTSSVFAIIKVAEDINFSLAEVGPGLADIAADLLESSDELSFGHSNYGYRYFLNLSSPSEFLNSPPGSSLKGTIVEDTIRDAYDLPFKGMLIFTEKQRDVYEITFLSPRQNFDSVLKELKPTIDSIELSDPTDTD
jgi:hypothetical protein